jgi:hypothetical protein
MLLRRSGATRDSEMMPRNIRWTVATIAALEHVSADVAESSALVLLEIFQSGASAGSAADPVSILFF